MRRAALLVVDAYAIDLDLTAGADTFVSTATVRFRCGRPGAGSFIEIRPIRLRDVMLNGRALDPATLEDNRLPLPDLDDENTVVVRAEMAYSNAGEGLHRFTDPVDGEVYLHAHTFLDHAQRVFACFDQPDLKAPVTLTVLAPPRWTVLANGVGHLRGPGRWVFEPTPPLSTYLVTVVAGPLHSLHALHDGIGFGLHCRRSLAEHLERDATELFTVTRQCMNRFHELFAVRYPFGKYDQVFVPELSSGAMENAGCVTFRDDFVFRSAVTDAQREERAVVMAHELAHMWFGDLVTMRWWDDLWLNESFAEYLGYRVTAEVTRFTGAWTSFAVEAKGWGYAADQRPSTHPVAPDHVPDAAAALLNFDGISYAKGAAALRQLVVWLGDEVFFAGLRRYFATHRFGNASLADLLAVLEVASGRDLAEWSRLWLRTAGVTTLRPVVEVDSGGRYTTVAVAQRPVDAQRPHRLAVSAYSRIHGAVVCRERVEVELTASVHNGHTSVTALVGAPAADLLLLNDGDLTYAKVRLLDVDLAALPALLPAVGEPLTRALLWSAVWDTTRDADMPAQRFVELAADVLPTETEVTIFDDVLHNARDVALPTYLPPAARRAALGRLAAACRRTLSCAPPGSGRQLAAARGFARCADLSAANLLRDWLAGAGLPDGLVMDAELRWIVLYRLAVLGVVGPADIEAETNRDPSAQGAQHAARCLSARPDPLAKARAWRMIVEDTDRSNRLVVANAEGFWQAEQEELTRPYVARYFDEMPQLAERRTPQALAKLAGAAFPQYAVSDATVALANRVLARTDLNRGLRRVILDGTDDVRRALTVRMAAKAAAD